MYNNTHAYTRPTKACNVWWRTEEGGGGGVGDGDGDGVGVIVGVGVGTVVASSSEAAVARRRWCGWWPWRSLSGGDGCADGGGGGVSGGGVGGGSVGVGTGVDGLAAKVLGVPGRHPVAGGGASVPRGPTRGIEPRTPTAGCCRGGPPSGDNCGVPVPCPAIPRAAEASYGRAGSPEKATKRCVRGGWLTF